MDDLLRQLEGHAAASGEGPASDGDDDRVLDEVPTADDGGETPAGEGEESAG